MSDPDVQVDVQGAEQLVELGRQLRQIGDKTIIPELRRSINAETKPLRAEIKAKIRAALPQAGGLAKWAATTPTTSTKIQRDRASVKIAMRKRGHDLVALNRGRVRHRVFGKAWAKQTQTVEAGWFDDAVLESATVLQQRVFEAIDRAVQRAVQVKGGV